VSALNDPQAVREQYRTEAGLAARSALYEETTGRYAGDVQAFPFEGGMFDAVAANWMLYHVPDVDCALSELARVLTPHGRLVAVTVGKDNLLELWRLVGAERARLARPIAFGAENGAQMLSRRFRTVEARDASGTVRIRDRDAVERYVSSTATWKRYAERVPAELEPFRARRSNVVLVADK